MIRRQMHCLLAAAGLMLGSALAQAEPPTGPTIAIIIDDMGNHVREAHRLIALDYPMTLAFLPHRPNTEKLARIAHAKGKEIMLHVPMANMRGMALGPGALTPGMSKLELLVSLRQSLRSIPNVSGVNNHMGSLLTQRREEMSWVMEELYNYPLYFVDSRTIATTVASKVAAAHDVPAMDRDVFLDDDQRPEAVAERFAFLIATARKNGSAIAIGHPHEATIALLERELPTLDAQGITVATVSALWAIRHPDTVMFADRTEALPERRVTEGPPHATPPPI